MGKRWKVCLRCDVQQEVLSLLSLRGGTKADEEAQYNEHDILHIHQF